MSPAVPRLTSRGSNSLGVCDRDHSAAETGLIHSLTNSAHHLLIKTQLYAAEVLSTNGVLTSRNDPEKSIAKATQCLQDIQNSLMMI